MMSWFTKLFVNLRQLAFILLYAKFVYSSVEFHIIPSVNASCPQVCCLTLLQLVANFSGCHGSELNQTDTVIFFQPGHHSLAVELYFTHANKILMTKDLTAAISVIMQPRCLVG